MLKGTKCEKRKRRNIYHSCCWISNMLSFTRMKTMRCVIESMIKSIKIDSDRNVPIVLDIFDNAFLDINFTVPRGERIRVDFFRFDFWRVNRSGDFTMRDAWNGWLSDFIEPLRVRESLTRRVLWKRCRCTHDEFIRRDILILVLDQIIKTFRPPLASSTITFSFLVLL